MLIEKSYDTGKIVINFAEADAAGPPLVMLHGGTLNWQSFEEFIPTLERSWHVYACDLRGHGKSGRAMSGYVFENFLPDVIAFIERHVKEPVVLAGFSLGASIALGVAARQPGFVRALILLEPASSQLCGLRNNVGGQRKESGLGKSTPQDSIPLEPQVECSRVKGKSPMTGCHGASD